MTDDRAALLQEIHDAHAGTEVARAGPAPGRAVTMLQQGDREEPHDNEGHMRTDS